MGRFPMPFSLTSEPTLRLAMLAFAGVCVFWGVARGIGRLVMLAVSVMAGHMGHRTPKRETPETNIVGTDHD